MAPKVQNYIIPDTTNVLAIPSDAEASPGYKCFVKFVSDSYLRGALFTNPTLYQDVLEAFWSTATSEEIALEDGKTKLRITYAIKGVHISFDATDVNKALGITEMDATKEHFDREATVGELIRFLNFIYYTATIDRYETEETTYPMQMEASSPLIEISSLSHQIDTTTITPYVAIDDASKKLDSKFAPSSNSIPPQIEEWLQPSMHQIGIGLQVAIQTHQVVVNNGLKSTYNDVVKKFPQISSLDNQNALNQKRIAALDGEVSLLKNAQKNLTDSVEKHLAFGLETSTMIKALFKNAYGDRIPSTIPVREMAVSDYNILPDKAKEAFDEKFFGPKLSTSSTSLNPEIAALQSEMISLKQDNQDLATSVALMGEKNDQNSKDLNHSLQAIQAQLALLVTSQSEMPDNKPKGEKKVSKKETTRRVTRASSSRAKTAEVVVTENQAKVLAEEEKEDMAKIKETSVVLRKKKGKCISKNEQGKHVQDKEKVECVQTETEAHRLHLCYTALQRRHCHPPPRGATPCSVAASFLGDWSVLSNDGMQSYIMNSWAGTTSRVKTRSNRISKDQSEKVEYQYLIA
ncbi:hypothetical protein POM88_044689 [Heracleum sosnowskyi]|uniref:Uncharacterized protein n=1 Tax=Heracleum sosnowskyi TaxID=360622 RepID=A0AAD8H388_9APIA|nr:hypothetical protein POM88_044689 [Heracleum sosnowskyi]